MSVAFTRETDLEATAADLPDRPIPPHANFVTPAGLASIEAQLAAARAAQADALAAGGIAEDRTAMARATRDLRYWAARRASAQLIEAPPADGSAGFGSMVTLERDDGRRQTWQIVGDDEADPARFKVSYMSPLARSLTGKLAGDTVTLPGGEAEIIAIA